MRVAYDAVRLADQLLLREAAALDKHMVGEDDATAWIGALEQRLAIRNFELAVGDRLVGTHMQSPAAGAGRAVRGEVMEPWIQ